MMASNRKKIEKEIVKTISAKISQLGFQLIDKEPNRFALTQDTVKWELFFHLFNNSTYSLFCKAAVRYMELTEIINDLLINTEFERYFDCGVGILENELKILAERQSLKISNLEEVNSFSELFFERIEKIRNAFWIPQSDPINQMESFKKSVHHWLNGNLIQNVTLWISVGIKENDLEKIKFGFERGRSEISEIIKLYGTNYHLEKDKELIEFLHLTVKRKGYNIQNAWLALTCGQRIKEKLKI